jgi:Vps23 core domain
MFTSVRSAAPQFGDTPAEAVYSKEGQNGPASGDRGEHEPAVQRPAAARGVATGERGQGGAPAGHPEARRRDRGVGRAVAAGDARAGAQRQHRLGDSNWASPLYYVFSGCVQSWPYCERAARHAHADHNGPFTSMQAQDMAIEDSLDVLSNALMGGNMSLKVYIRSFRLLAEEQYKYRLLGSKIQERQRSAQHAHNGQAVQLPQGDAWRNTAAYPAL